MSISPKNRGKLISVLSYNKIRFSNGWTNYMQTVSNPAALVVEVASEEELQMVLKTISTLNLEQSKETKITVRATAGWSDDKSTQCCFFWKEIQESEYNEGYSFSEVVGGQAAEGTPGTDVIIRFAKKFHKMKVIGPMPNPELIRPGTPIHQLPSSLVEVSAGVQISELADYLRKKNLSLPTVSMIAWVTAVGLSGTAGHGTGRDEPAFSGLIQSIKVCDMDGNIREIDAKHPDFNVLRGGHSGLLGVVLSVKLRAVKAFNLRETIDLYTDTKAMKGQMSALLKENQYVSIMGTPSYACPEVGKLVPKWQVRKWNYTTEKPTHIGDAPYAPDIESFNQELQARLGASVMDFLLDSGLKHLLPAFMLLSAAVVSGTRGTKPIVDYENHITHPQVAFPKAMRDVSYLIPVKDGEAGQTLEAILQTIEAYLNDAGTKGDFPVTYAIYVRYLKGTNGGLSTSATQAEDERILAIDVVTHPDAPGITRFEEFILGFLNSMSIVPRNHLGKNFPSGVTCYEQFLGPKAMAEFKAALERWHHVNGRDGAERLLKSPFLTPYMELMLSPAPQLVLQDVMPRTVKDRTHKDHSFSDCHQFLSRLHEEVRSMDIQGEEGVSAKIAFLKACSNEIELRNATVRELKPM